MPNPIMLSDWIGIGGFVITAVSAFVAVMMFLINRSEAATERRNNEQDKVINSNREELMTILTKISEANAAFREHMTTHYVSMTSFQMAEDHLRSELEKAKKQLVEMIHLVDDLKKNKQTDGHPSSKRT